MALDGHDQSLRLHGDVGTWVVRGLIMVIPTDAASCSALLHTFAQPSMLLASLMHSLAKATSIYAAARLQSLGCNFLVTGAR